MTTLEIVLLVLLIMISLIVVWLCRIIKNLTKRNEEWKETANLFSNMYAESAEILADLVVNQDDFDEKRA